MNLPNQPKSIKRVGNYVIDKKLNEGTYGEVKLATHSLTGEKVAIKILEKAKITSDEDLNKIIREIQVLKLLTHQNIVKLLEVLDTPNNIFIITENIANGELFEYVSNRKQLTEKESCKFFRQMISALTYCHQRKVCHRDLKLENIMLDSNFDIKIIDFGLSNILNEKQLLKTACGSPSYVAPEVLSGRKYNGSKIDIWSIGVILYAMLCGALPFDDEELVVLYKKIIAGRFEIPSFVSEKAQDLLRKIIVVDPDKRASIEQIISHPWFVDTLLEEYVPPPSMDVLPMIDLAVVYSITKAIPEWPAAKIINSLNAQRHNQITATYYLTSEKLRKTDQKTWSIEQQQQYAQILGVKVKLNGQLVNVVDE